MLFVNICADGVCSQDIRRLRRNTTVVLYNIHVHRYNTVVYVEKKIIIIKKSSTHRTV